MSSVPYRKCSVEGCESTNYEARGFCKAHYNHARNSGQLQRLPFKSFEQRFWEKVDKNGPIHPVLKTPCWVWTACTNRKGYGQLNRGGREEGLVLAHRASWEIHKGKIPEGLWVLHKCDNPPCVNPDHHFLGDVVDNYKDMIKKGRYSPPPESFRRGEKHHSCKLTPSQVISARLAFDTGTATITDLALKHGVARATMHAIVIRKTWRHIE